MQPTGTPFAAFSLSIALFRFGKRDELSILRVSLPSPFMQAAAPVRCGRAAFFRAHFPVFFKTVELGASTVYKMATDFIIRGRAP